MTLTISDVFNEAWDLTKRHGLTFAVFFFLLAVLFNGLLLGTMPGGYWQAVFDNDVAGIRNYSDREYWPNIVFYVLQLFVYVGVVVAMLNLARGGKTGLSWRSYKLPLSTYLNYIGYSLLSAILVLVGILFLIIPGIYLAVRLAFGSIYILDHPDADIKEAFRFSWRATEGKEFTLLGLGIVSGFVAALGLLLCCIGVYYTIVISQFALVVTYLWLLDNNSLKSEKVFYSSYSQTQTTSQSAEAPRREAADQPQPTEQSASPKAEGNSGSSHQNVSSGYDRTKY